MAELQMDREFWDTVHEMALTQQQGPHTVIIRMDMFGNLRVLRLTADDWAPTSYGPGTYEYNKLLAVCSLFETFNKDDHVVMTSAEYDALWGKV